MHPLEKYRRDRNISGIEAAASLKISDVQVWRIENYKRTPSLDLATRIEEYTGGVVRADEIARMPHGWRMIKDDQVAKLSSLDP